MFFTLQNCFKNMESKGASLIATSCILLFLITRFGHVETQSYVITDREKSLTYGKPGVLPCSHDRRAFAVYWTKGGTPVKAKLLVVLDQHCDRQGPGLEEGRFNISDDYSLIIKEAEFEDEGRYFCEVSDFHGDIMRNHTDVTVRGQMEPEGHVITDPEKSLTYQKPGVLPCSYDRKVFAVYWKKGETEIEASLLVVLDQQYEKGYRKGPGLEEGRFNISDDYSLIINEAEIGDEGRYFCEVSDFQFGVVIRNHTDVTVTDMTALPAWVIVVITLLSLSILSAFLIIVFMRRRKQQKSRDPEDANDGTAREEESVPLIDEQADILAAPRAEIINYKPGEASNISLDIAHINLGIFGPTAYGKSAFINSLDFAVTGKYEEKYHEVPMSETVSARDERKEIALTTCIHAVEIRQIRGLDESNLAQLAETSSESNESDPIHCPVFVYKYDGSSVEPASHLISTIQEELKLIYGRNLDIMIVITHKEKLTNLEDVKKNLIKLFQMPEENIWFFENYTELHHDENKEKSKEYLDFISECLKKGESNCRLQGLESNGQMESEGQKESNSQRESEGQKESNSQRESDGQKKKKVAGIAGALFGGAAAGAAAGVVGGPVGMCIGGAVGFGVGAAAAAVGIGVAAQAKGPPTDAKP